MTEKHRLLISVCALLSQALSQVLTLADEPYRGHSTYYGWLTSMYRKKRKILADGLEKCGLVAMEGQVHAALEMELMYS